LISVTSGSLKFMTGGRARGRIKVTLAATDDLTGVAYQTRGDLVRGSLQRSIQEISSVVPNLVVDWATVSTPAQLVVGDAPTDELPALIEVARRVGVLVDPVVDRDVAL
jgi:hypothetical protein